MAAPSLLHESRVARLRDLGLLSGHTTPFRLGRWLAPDVALRDTTALRLFVADAKATERSTNPETRSRLRAYASALVPWRRAGFAIRVTLCVTPGDDEGWTAILADLANPASSVRVATLAPDERLVWVDLPAVLDDVGGDHYRSAHGQLAHRRRHVQRGRRAL